jgi:hypothetical protein|tara:strand:- start:2668 stop:3339 length:672 start_codon:yes stop_codon:yes gene_type:complete
MNFSGYDTNKKFDYENGFYLTSNPSRLGKVLTHYELYKMIINLPGDIVEFGVFKGSSLIKWATFRELFENTDSRKVIGFDIFGKFPETDFIDDMQHRDEFMKDAGEKGISIEELHEVFEYKELQNIDLVKGDILKTAPKYIKDNPQLKISLLHIDVDIYEPSKIILETMYDSVVEGGLIVLDDYGTFPGETKAVDDFFRSKPVKINKFSFSQSTPVYIVKKTI